MIRNHQAHAIERLENVVSILKKEEGVIVRIQTTAIAMASGAPEVDTEALTIQSSGPCRDVPLSSTSFVFKLASHKCDRLDEHE
jgi:hypothetical protein